VKLYICGLKNSRYFLYTRTGDTLVSETQVNRVSCLSDTDNEGFPDQRKKFPNAVDGLNYPYGMAFVNEFFCVGNRNYPRRHSWDSKNCYVVGTGEVMRNYPPTVH
jgi:hypothetical protein